jgi:hypothetical protein
VDISSPPFDNLRKRYEVMQRKIRIVSSLRSLLDLSEKENISAKQWSAIEPSLYAIEEQLLYKLNRAGRRYLPYLHLPKAAVYLNTILGRIDLQLTKAITYFDTYLDILSQRKIPQLGSMLAGCDVIAWDALNKRHPALQIIAPPIVFCDRGFGASIIREGVAFPGRIRNAVPLLQIPYSRLAAKHDLTSILHEAGHEAMIRLGLESQLPLAFKIALKEARAPDSVIDLFALWTSEIGPDFWTFCNSGMAQTSSIKEMLSLPSENVLEILSSDPHPSVYLRVLLSIAWCRRQWGNGDWDAWEREWRTYYPLEIAPNGVRPLLQICERFIPVITETLFRAKFETLNGKSIPGLFDLQSLNPVNIEKFAENAKLGKLDLRKSSPCTQLSIFRFIRDQKNYSEESIDKIMTNWLVRLGEIRHGVVSKHESHSERNICGNASQPGAIDRPLQIR